MMGYKIASYSFARAIPVVLMHEPLVAELVDEAGPVSSADIRSKKDANRYI